MLVYSGKMRSIVALLFPGVELSDPASCVEHPEVQASASKWIKVAAFCLFLKQANIRAAGRQAGRRGAKGGFHSVNPPPHPASSTRLESREAFLFFPPQLEMKAFHLPDEDEGRLYFQTPRRCSGLP